MDKQTTNPTFLPVSPSFPARNQDLLENQEALAWGLTGNNHHHCGDLSEKAALHSRPSYPAALHAGKAKAEEADMIPSLACLLV